jgi:SAM-dependent methyltransferase
MADGNTGFIDCWNNILVPKWNRFRHILSGNGKTHSDLAYKLFDIKEGEKILDIGSGYGETSIEMAKIVGEKGSITGLDCTKAFLETAKKEASAAGVTNVTFVEGDAQRYELPSEYFDVGYSRFGVMFFENRVLAMRNVHKALKPGGRLCMIVWRRLVDNPCWGLGKEVALKFLPPPGEGASTCGPGPFSMSHEDTDRDMLKAAGFNNVEVFEKIDADAFMGTHIEEAIDFQILVGPSGEIIREAGELGKEKLPEIRQAMKEMLSPYLKENGIFMPSSTWAIMARKDA